MNISPDLGNALFELAAAFFIMNHARAVWKSKQAHGISIISTIFFASLAMPSQALPLHSEQIKIMCKIVDPSFLNILPVLVDAKVKGASEKELLIINNINHKVYHNLTRVPPFLNAIEAIHSSKVTTAQEAIAFLEQKCFDQNIQKISN